MTRANFVSGIGGANTPIVSVDLIGFDPTYSSGSYHKIPLNTERIDTDNAFTPLTILLQFLGKLKIFYVCSCKNKCSKWYF